MRELDREELASLDDATIGMCGAVNMDGGPLGMVSAAMLLADIDKRRIAWAQVGEVSVSTVFLVLPVDGEPFEILTQGPEWRIVERFRIRQDAERRHEQIVRLLLAYRLADSMRQVAAR